MSPEINSAAAALYETESIDTASHLLSLVRYQTLPETLTLTPIYETPTEENIRAECGPAGKPLNRAQRTWLSKLVGAENVHQVERLSDDQRLEFAANLGWLYSGLKIRRLNYDKKMRRAAQMIAFLGGQMQKDLASKSGLSQGLVYSNLSNMVGFILERKTREELLVLIPFYDPTFNEENKHESEIIELVQFRESKPRKTEKPPLAEKPSKTPLGYEELKNRLVEKRRARNEESGAYTSVRHLPQRQLVDVEVIRTGNLDRLFELSAQGNCAATEKLAKHFLPLAKKIAYKYRGGGESAADIEAVANLGLANALKRYDITKGVSFLAYAVPTIEGEIKKYFRDHGWGMHIQRQLQENALLVTRTIRQIEDKGRGWTFDQVIDATGLSYEEALEAFLVTKQAHWLESLDRLTGLDDEDSDISIGDTIAGEVNEDYIIGQVNVSTVVGEILDKFPTHYMEIVVRSMYFDQVQSDIADAVGISQMQVSRVLGKFKDMLYASLDLDQVQQ